MELPIISELLHFLIGFLLDFVYPLNLGRLFDVEMRKWILLVLAEVLRLHEISESNMVSMNLTALFFSLSVNRVEMLRYQFVSEADF